MPCFAGDIEYSYGHVLTRSGTSCGNSDFPAFDGPRVGRAIFCQCEALAFFAIISHFYPPLMYTSQLASLFA